MDRRRKQTRETTDRQSELLDVLTHRVRVLSIAQVARTWWPDAKTAQRLAARYVTGLEQRGLVRRVTLLAKPEILPEEPLATWQPGLPLPDFGAIAYALRKRRVEPAISTPCLVAASVRPPRPSDTTHDLHLAAVYLQMRAELPTRARSWIFESSLIRPGQKVPDAIVMDGKAKTVIECGGEYRKQRLVEDHEFFASLGYGYEIW